MKSKSMDYTLKNTLAKIFWMLFGYENFTKFRFYRRHGYRLNLDNPQTLNEKICWIKCFGHLERFAKYVDKYDVRNFVAAKIGEEYLIPALGIYERVEDIDFENLPTPCILKATHSCTCNIIVQDKTKLAVATAKTTMKKWLKRSLYTFTGEKQYQPLKGRIVMEKLLEDPSGDLKDYKFFCVWGNPVFIKVDADRNTAHKTDMYDANWNRLPITIGYPNLPKPAEKPAKFDEMVDICHKLASEFAFVRVDLYYTNDRIYFSELTFTHAGGMDPVDPPEQDKVLGAYIDISGYNQSA